MHRVSFRHVFLLLIALLFAFPSCVLTSGGECDGDKDCESYYVCFRNWCMPEKVRDRLVKVIEQGQPGDAGPDAPPSDDTTPEPRPEATPESQPDCASPCKSGDTRPCYPDGKSGCKSDGTDCKGECKAGTQTCDTSGVCPTWSACVGAVTPADEICDDNKDNDCDGQINEDLKRPCYTGTAGTENKGECKGGTQGCQADGTWGTCDGEIKPQSEICDNQKDENCDGQADEGCDCKAGDQRPCGSQEGECKQGTQSCGSNSKWGQCTGAVEPTAEVCDNKDNDCDGMTDEDLKRSCYTGTQGTSGNAPCKEGVETCSAGSWGACVGEVTPTAEICDNIDNDCNGKIDDGIAARGCYSGPQSTRNVGICKDGTQTCSTGNWSSCSNDIKPAAEICDGKDNDCDGTTDEGCQCTPGDTGACGSDVGECKKGTRSCKSDGTWGDCNGDTKPTTEVCDGKDNDCDGMTDENIPPRPCYTGPPSTQGIGECKQGTQACVNGQWSTTCTGEVRPTPETCDNKDNDCDLDVDEGLSRACYTGSAATKGVGQCKDGTQACSKGSWGTCTNEVTPLSEEKCDGKDHDCDGKIDDGCVTTFAGSTQGFKDAQGTAAQFNNPTAIIADGDDLYVIDSGNFRIRQIDKNANVTTLAGDGTQGYVDGPAKTARFDQPCGLYKDGTTLFITEKNAHTIRYININNSNPSQNAVGAWAGQKNQPGFANGTPATFNGPCGIVKGFGGDLFVAEIGNHAIRRLTGFPPSATTFTGGNGQGDVDGSKGVAKFDFSSGPPQLSFYNGKMYVISKDKVREIDASGAVTTYLGFPSGIYKTINSVDSFTLGPTGASLYFADNANGEIRRTIPTTDYTRIFAGSGGGDVDGPLSSAKFRYVGGMLSHKGDLYISDETSHKIRKITLP